MSFGQFLSILRARWWLALLVLLLTLASSLGASLLVARQYTATASVVVDFKPDPISAFAFGGGASPAYMATQVDIINSDRVARRVVDRLRRGRRLRLRQSLRGKFLGCAPQRRIGGVQRGGGMGREDLRRKPPLNEPDSDCRQQRRGGERDPGRQVRARFRERRRDGRGSAVCEQHG